MAKSQNFARLFTKMGPSKELGTLHDNYLMKKGKQIWALVGPDPRIWAMPES